MESIYSMQIALLYMLIIFVAFTISCGDSKGRESRNVVALLEDRVVKLAVVG